ncbi:MAG: 16S rRNA (cytosine(967)-C(5))-methyltransferase RsmB [Clostridiales bacterium]|nr:16S rRNA (cytosine(967)-C(5))-methyltransferase RsmB [Clostridiales bacterium]
MTAGINTREIIVDMLLELEKTDAYVNLLLADTLERYDYLDGRDKAFIKRVVEGTVERRIQLDYILDGVSTIPVRKMKPLIRALLRMSVYQILFMDAVPDAAVCNEAVKLVGKRKFTSLQGYVNGVLRSVSRRKGELSYPDKDKEPLKYLSVVYSMPEWLVEHFLRSYDMATVEKMLVAFLQSAPVTLRIEERLGEEEREALFKKWKKNVATITRHSYLSYAVQIEKVEGLRKLSGYDEGLFMVQDVSSMLVVEAAGIKKGQTVIDLCASPGGKSLHAASKLDGTGRVLSYDLTEKKVAKLEENRIRMQMKNMTTAVNDAVIYREELKEAADVVIADVSCSGLGVIGKKQDIKYHVSEQSLKEITKLQKDILKNAAAYVKDGGVLMYSTCTINPQENEKMVEWFCESFPFKKESMSAYLPDELKKDEGGRGMLQLLPGVHKTDGFFLAKLRKE